MNNKATRFLALILCVMMLAGTVPASAEVATIGITLMGSVPLSDGSFRTILLDGSFRIFQNGQELGVIAAGRETLPVNGSERIRIEPVPETFDPGWDLTAAYRTLKLSGGGSRMIPVTLTLADPSAAPAELNAVQTAAPETPAPTDTPAPTATAAPDPTAAPATEAPTEAPTQAETQAPAATPAPETTVAPSGVDYAALNSIPAVSVVTPALPPYEAPAASPEPVLSGIPAAAETGSLRVQVFHDKNGNGNQGNYEDGVRDIPVWLLNEAEKTLALVRTDESGIALFENLPAGRYKTRASLPEEWYFTKFGAENNLAYNAYEPVAGGEETSRVLTVSAGQEAQQGIGIHPDASVFSGFCWLEEATDGLYTDGEGRIPGVRIRLKLTDSDLVFETETDAQGNWRIGHLRPGFYILSAEAPDGLMPTRYTQSRGQRSYLTSDNPLRRVEASQGKARTDMNIGFNWAARVYGRVYLDSNHNGLYDEGEPPMAGVKLYAKFTYDGEDAATAISGEDGTYVLDGLRGNNYAIQVILPADGCFFTRLRTDQPLGNFFPPRKERRDGMLRNYILADSERREMNIGVVYPASITGTVYYDDNFSATMDGKEKTVYNFTVTALDESGEVAATAKSDGRGNYELKGLAPGYYTLEVNAVKGYAFTKAGEGNVILNRTGGAGYSEPFFVYLGGKTEGKDIGMIRPGTVKGTVFADRNDNGLRDAQEDGLAGTVVRLMSETEGECFRGIIGADGAFLFDAVMPGRYYLEYELPARAVFARTVQGGSAVSGEGSTARTESFDFVTGQVYEAPLCGALTLGRISGTAYRDHDGNGRMENEETLSGLIVRLIPSREELEESLAVTGEDGAFLLDNLRPDNYLLEVDCPEGMVLSRTDALALPLKAGLRDQTVSLPLTMGAEWLDQQAGAVIPAAILGQVWMDENDNGLFDEGERTPAGYTVTVTDESTGLVFDTPVTDADGRFSASGMIPGSFSVSLPLDERTLAAKPGDSAFREENGVLVRSGIVLREDETCSGLLLGVVRYTTVRGQAWIDRGENVEPLSGVQVVMKDPDGNVLAKAETDADGAYALEKLMPGRFTLEATAPAGCVLIEPGDPRLSESRRSAFTHPMNRTGSTDETTLEMDRDLEMDIGCVLPGRLGDFCWVDLNRDGLQAGDEPGIPDVKIELLRDGALVDETRTNVYGFWRFTDLYPADYVLRVTAPAEVKPTRRRTDLPIIASVLEESDGETVYSVPLTVESNKTLYDADLGFVLRKDGVLPAGVGEAPAQIWR